MRLKGKLACVEFWDHVINDKVPMRCQAFGRIIKNHSKYIVLCSWDVLDGDAATVEANREIITIIKSTIIKLEVAYTKN
jgi:hypothetical protein